MADNVIIGRFITRLPIPVERVLNGALEEGLDEVVVIGYKDGKFSFRSSQGGGPEVLWALEEAKLRLLNVVVGTPDAG